MFTVTGRYSMNENLLLQRDVYIMTHTRPWRQSTPPNRTQVFSVLFSTVADNKS